MGYIYISMHVHVAWIVLDTCNFGDMYFWVHVLLETCTLTFHLHVQVKSMLKYNLIKLRAIHDSHFINDQQHYSTNLMHPMTIHSVLKEIQWNPKTKNQLCEST